MDCDPRPHADGLDVAKPTRAVSRATKKKKSCSHGVVLSDDEFALLLNYLDREDSITWDPNSGV